MQIMEVSDWTTFKSLFGSKMLNMQYSNGSDRYNIYMPEASTFLWHITLLQDGGPDVTDFEENYKPTSNQPLESKAAFGRPERFTSSPQPVGTMEMWSGKQVSLSIDPNQLTTTVDLIFSQDVYLKGGDYFANNNHADDKVSVFAALNGITLLALADSMPVPSSVESTRTMRGSDAMLFPKGMALRVMYEASQVTDVEDYDFHITLNYYQPDPRVKGLQTNLIMKLVNVTEPAI
jgi:hypothetical protein